MDIKTKYKIGDILHYRRYHDHMPQKFLVAMICVRETGVYYFNGTDTRHDMGVQENQLELT